MKKKMTKPSALVCLILAMALVTNCCFMSNLYQQEASSPITLSYRIFSIKSRTPNKRGFT